MTKWTGAAAVVLLWCAAGPASASVFVRFDTVMGSFDVELFDDATPLTVANFLGYADDGDYVDSFFHRSAKLLDGTPFVVQGGGFTFVDNATGLGSVPQDPPVLNEPGISNTRGTIAMAKLGGDPDSATNQWFFNLGDNSANLDNQNGGFTVFGRVLGSGMDIVDAIAALPIVNAGAPFDTLPVVELPDGTIFKEHLVIVNSITRVNQMGDANNDGQVTGADLIAVQQNFGSAGQAPGPGLLPGDANDDGQVTGADLIAVQQNFGDALGVVTAAAAVVPEPGAWALLMLGVIGLSRRSPPR